MESMDSNQDKSLANIKYDFLYTIESFPPNPNKNYFSYCIKLKYIN